VRGNRATFANQRRATKAFAKKARSPRMIRLEASLARWMAGPAYFITPTGITWRPQVSFKTVAKDA
jgi:hypothetical protein